MEEEAVDPMVVRHRRRLFVIFTLGLIALVILGAIRGGVPLFTWDERVYETPVEVHLRSGSTIWIRKVRHVFWANPVHADGDNTAATIYDTPVWVETAEGETLWLSGMKSQAWWRWDKGYTHRTILRGKVSEE